MKNMLIYNLEKMPLIIGLGEFIYALKRGKDLKEEKKEKLSSLVKKLVSFTCDHGFYGNLWQMLLTYFLLMDENPYTLFAERSKDVSKESIYSLALVDAKTLRELFLEDIGLIEKALSLKENTLKNYDRAHHGATFNENIRDMIKEVSDKLLNSQSEKEFLDILTEIYEVYGVGDIGLHKAFRIEEDGSLVPINKIANVFLDDFIGLESQKAELIKNTRAFIEGRPANNCLLYGDAGTGKSSSIKAIANEYFKDGLRIVEIYKHQLKSLNDVVKRLKGRGYKFIIYMDDLSFEEFETEYKYLKALIEGGLEKKPENVLIYATSNRRHLVRESFKDREEDIHRSDTMQEKLSLFNRFGVTIYYGAPDKAEYKNIVLGLKARYGLKLSDEELLLRANAWELSHGGRSGRSAQQLLDYLMAEEM